MINGDVSIGGAVKTRVIRAEKAPVSWRVRNALRYGFVKGFIAYWLARVFSKVMEVPTITSRLMIRVRRADGQWIDYGTVNWGRVVTDAGVAFLVDDWDNNAQDLTTLNYHGCGTGGTAEAASQTALVTESTTALNPDSTRATGTRSQPSANIYQSVGTLTFDGSAAVTEHGIFSQAATGGGTMWDRSLFSAINVASGDSIQFTYQATINSGG